MAGESRRQNRLGDFNTENCLWSAENNIPSGKRSNILADQVIAADLCVFIDGSATRVPETRELSGFSGVKSGTSRPWPVR